MNVSPQGVGTPTTMSPMTVVTPVCSSSTMPLFSSTSPTIASPGRVTHRSPATSPVRKRLKLDLSSTAGNPTALKRKLFEWRTARLRRRTSSYRDNMAELFFLRSGTNVTDNLPQFRRKPSQKFLDFLLSSSAPARVVSEVQTAVIGQNSAPFPPNLSASTPCSPVTSQQPIKRPVQSYSPHISGADMLSPVKIGELQVTYNARQTASRPSQPSSIPPPTAAIYSQEQVGERMKQEGWVMRRVAELTRDGLWPARRLPQVAERPRPVSAWDMVLEEMRWMATDFAQERLWKKAAARVQSAACREHVIRKQEQEQAIQLEMNSENHKKMIARRLAEKIESFWSDVECCYQFEQNKRRDIHIGNSLSQQSGIVSDQPSLKRKHSDMVSMTNSFSSVSPLTPESQHENGVSSDCESSISEQESWELLNMVQDSELNDLDHDARTPLDQLVSERYPGYQEDLSVRWEEEMSNEDFDGVSDWDTDSDCGMEDSTQHYHINLDSLLGHPSDLNRTSNSDGCLLSLAEKAKSLLPKSVIHSNPATPSVPCKVILEPHQYSTLEWLSSACNNNLPSLLLDEPAEGKVTIAALVSHLTLTGSSSGPHLLICPVSSLVSWASSLSRVAPSLTVHIYSGNPSERRRSREAIFLSSQSPDIVLTSYRTFFLDSDWFLSRSWSLLILTEIQNIISAGSNDHLSTLVNIKSSKRTLLMSGQLRETPIDLWNTLYLLFPSVFLQKEESGHEPEIEIEGTPEYAEIQQKLLSIVTGFCYQRSKLKYLGSMDSNNKETKLAVPLDDKKRKLYDDYLAQTFSKEDNNQRDLRVVWNVVQRLREICNEPVSTSSKSSSLSCSLPDWCYLDKHQSSHWSNIKKYDPLENISLDQINLVFLSQEVTTTVVTSARLRSIKASRKMIQELHSSSSNTAPPVPRHRLQLGLETLTRNIGGGWSLAGLGLGEGMTLVKAANGQVYRMSVNDVVDNSTSNDVMEVDKASKLGAFHQDSIDTIAAVNHWRCDGFPLYGKDLVKSLTITNNLRPVKSRFRGQGYVNCLNTEDFSSNSSSDADWRYSTRFLDSLCKVGNENLKKIIQNSDPNGCVVSDNKMKALHNIVYNGYKEGKKIVVVTGIESLVPAIARVCNKSGIRYCAIRSSDSFTRQSATVSWWLTEPRMTVLVLSGLELGTTHLDLSSADTVVLVDSGPGQWEPTVTCPVVRLLSLGTVEEGLSRMDTLRKILQDIKSKQDSVVLSKQTVSDIVRPTPDNGYTKKKEKGLSESEASMWNLFSTYLGSSSDSAQSLLDLAELETVDEVMWDPDDDIDEDTVDLVQWRHNIEPIKRYGMRLLKENIEIRLGLSKSCVIVEDVNKNKYEFEEKLIEKYRTEEESYGDLITYSKDLVDREWKSGDGLVAEIWKPRGQAHVPDMISPGTVFSGYSKDIIPENQLPPVHVKKEKKATPAPIAGVICQAMSPPTLSGPMSPASNQDVAKIKIKREDQPTAAPPKSLFERPRPNKMVPRRPIPGLQSSTFQSSLTNSGPLSSSSMSSHLQSMKPLLRETDAGPEWTIQEDWALHQAVLNFQELNLATTSTSAAGHIVNWDLVSDMVNAVSSSYRSAKQCRARWEACLVPREEGRLTYDITPKKLKKEKKLGLKVEKKTPVTGGQSMKTGALYRTDNNNAISSAFSSRFETIKSIANKRTPTTTPLLVNPTLRNPKHAAVLAESGIDYDSPVSPIQVAANRAERIQANKAANRTNQLSAVQPSGGSSTTGSTVSVMPQQQPQLPQSPVPAQIRTSTPTVSLPSQPAQAVVVGISQPLQQAVIQNSGTVTRPNQPTVTALSVQDLLKSVNTSSGVAAMSTAAGGRLQSGQIIVTQAGKTAVAQTGQTLRVANQQLTPQQLALLKQQALNKKVQEAQLKQRLAAASNASSNSTSSAGGVVTTTAAAGTSKVTVTAAAAALPTGAIGRGQVIARQNVRNITDPEFKALLAKQKVGQTGVVQVPANSMSAAQLQQLGIQVATSSAATLVKTVSAPAGVQMAGQPGTSKAVTLSGVPSVNLQAGQLKAVTGGRGAAIKGSPQQIQQLQLKQLQLLQSQKGGQQGQRVTLSTGGKGVPTQFIVPGGNKGLPAAVTVQQLQQICKGAAGSQGQVIQGQQIRSGQVQTRVIPVSGARQQTIQVVTAMPQRQGGAPNVTINPMGRPAGELTAGSHVKIQVPQGASQQQILSQISTALGAAGHGQNIMVRTSTGTSSTVLQPTQVVQQSVAAGSPQQQQRQPQQQMVNLQLNVTNPVQQQQPQQQQQQPVASSQSNSQPQQSNNSDV